MKTVEERFFEKVHINTNTGCWEWTAGRNPAGYGRFYAGKGLSRLAHRFSYSLTGKEIKEGNLICHTCDNPKCVNPFHLFQGTQTDNMRDMNSKGRTGYSSAKLKIKEVELIKLFLNRFPPTKKRHSFARGAARFLSNWFHVSEASITRIHQDECWSHIK